MIKKKKKILKRKVKQKFIKSEVMGKLVITPYTDPKRPDIIAHLGFYPNAEGKALKDQIALSSMITEEDLKAMRKQYNKPPSGVVAHCAVIYTKVGRKLLELFPEE